MYHAVSELGPAPVWSFVPCCIRARANPGVVRCTMLRPSLGQPWCGPLCSMLYRSWGQPRCGPLCTMLYASSCQPRCGRLYHAGSELGPALVWPAVPCCIRARASPGVDLCAQCCIRARASPGVVLCTMLYPSSGQPRCGPPCTMLYPSLGQPRCGPLYHVVSELGPALVWSFVPCCMQAWASPGVVRCTMLYPSSGQPRCGPL